MLVERKANITDLGFINGCVLYGARKGHYSFDAENQKIVTLMKQEIQSVVLRNELLDKRRAFASIFTLNNKRIGLLILSEDCLNGDGIELYAMSILKKHQNKGYASQLLNNMLNYYVHENIYARCSLNSEKMAQLLYRRGFRLDSIDGEYNVLIRDAIADHDLNRCSAV
ncbi:MAG: GNAT family N-acetyltransferase [Gammaproteobacteria bacterium]|nr:GNAT family N-acetyltransferase [Gammaproteobacteria bacterium]